MQNYKELQNYLKEMQSNYKEMQNYCKIMQNDNRNNKWLQRDAKL